MDLEIDRLARRLERAQSLLVITGAGISADSGLPTYRGVGGLYEGRTTADAVPIEVALSGPTMAANPALCWTYIAQIEAACRHARPNLAHRVLAALERRVPRMWVLTQNVDGFHARAGSRAVIEIHGNLHRLYCTECGARRRVDSYAGLEVPPRCDGCEGLIRPEVVLFEEMLPARPLAQLRSELERGFDVVVSVGTSHAFPYILQPLVLARRTGSFTAEVNPEPTVGAAFVDVAIAATAKRAFAALAARLGLSVTDPD